MLELRSQSLVLLHTVWYAELNILGDLVWLQVVVLACQNLLVSLYLQTESCKVACILYRQQWSLQNLKLDVVRLYLMKQEVHGLLVQALEVEG